jgi:subtilisin-like proprotein convertase family protein
VLGTVAGTQMLSRQASAAAWMMPDTAVEYPNAGQLATMTALADAIVPNWDGAPGAIESEAIATLNDPYYGVNPYISELCSDIDAWAGTFWVWGRSFLGLSNSERDDCIAERLGYDTWPSSMYKDAYLGCIALTKLNYFGGLVNSVGMNYIGFPGATDGYGPNTAAGAYHSADTPKAINDNTTVNSYISVTGPGTVKDFKVTIYITHTYQGDLVIKLYAPNGAVTTLHNRTGGGTDNYIKHDLVVTAFAGVTAAGTWRLEVQDAAGGDIGSLKFWSFRLRTRSDGPSQLLSADTPKTIADLATVSSTITATNPGTVTAVKARLFLTHTYRGDLVVTLFSPAGTAHVLHNRTGGSADDLYFENVPITTFNGQTAAGAWRLDVQDAAGGDVGVLQSWGLELATSVEV